MNTAKLRGLIQKFGPFGYLLVGAYLLFHAVWHDRRRRVLAMATVGVLLAGAFGCLLVFCSQFFLFFDPLPIDLNDRGSANPELALNAPDNTPLAYRITDLGTLPGTKYSVPRSVNNRGDVAGWSEANGQTRGFVWQRGKMQEIAGFGGSLTYANDINDDGDVVGLSTLRSGYAHAFRWQDGRTRDITPDWSKGKTAFAFGINAEVDIAGGATLPDGTFFQAALWQGGKPSSIGALPGDHFSLANSISDKGLMAGNSTEDGECWRPFLYVPGRGKQPVPTLSGDSSFATGLNDAGQVIGGTLRLSNERRYAMTASPVLSAGCLTSPSVFLPCNNTTNDDFFYQWLKHKGRRTAQRGFVVRAFLTQNGKAQDLGDLGGGSSNALAINRQGVVVGWSVTSGDTLHAFLWQKGSLCDMNTLLPTGSGWELGAATAINARGQIAGIGLHHGELHAFLLTPGN